MSDHIVAAEYVVGNMPSAERRQAEAHLQECATCRAAVEAARRNHARQTMQHIAGTLLTFVVEVLQGSFALVAPTLPEGRPEWQREVVEEPRREPLHFEPLRVLQPTVVAGTRRLQRFVGRFGLVLLRMDE